MPAHDAYARLTPYELAFPVDAGAPRLFEEIRGEASTRGLDGRDPTAFLQLGVVGRALRELPPEDAESGAFSSFALLLYHAFRHHEEGEHLYFLSTSAVRALAASSFEGAGVTPPPAPAGYAQLPQHLVWTGVGEGQPPESVDGFFWSATGDNELHTLLISGIRPDRPGFSVVALPPVPLGREWALDLGADALSATLPGAEIQGLYQLHTGAEALFFVGATLRRLAGPGLKSGEGSDAPGPPPPSRLPYLRAEGP